MPTWTKKDYEVFAQILHEAPLTDNQRNALQMRFAWEFRDDNSLFSGGRWLLAVERGELIHRGGTADISWTSKTFNMITRNLREARETDEIDDMQLQYLIGQFAREAKRVNPRFDIDKFREAATPRPLVFHVPASIPRPKVSVHPYRRRKK